MLDFVFFFFCGIIFLKSTKAIDSVYFLLFCLLLYFGFKYFFASIIASKLVEDLLKIYCIVCFIFIGYSFYKCIILSETVVTLYNPNISIFSNLLSSLLVFFVSLVIYSKKSSKSKLLLLLVFIALFILLLFTKGRAGWVGFFVSLIFVFYKSTTQKNVKKVIAISATLIFIPILLLFYFYKEDSSQGRLLIYKISFSILKENWLLGIGHGHFKVEYGLAQARYFSTHNIDSKEALLADNTIYAFNDYLQFILENGILGLSLLIAFGYLLLTQIRKRKIDNQSTPLFIAAQASLICIFTTSMFSYSLQIFPIIFQAIICFAIITSFTEKDNKNNLESKIYNKVYNSFLICLTFLLCIHFGCMVFYQYTSKKAFELKQIGFKTNSEIEYKKIETSYIKEGSTLYEQAEILYYLNKLQEAKNILAEAKTIYTRNDVYKLSAKIENDLGNFKAAEQDYKTAIFMVPNKMLSRKNLLDFFLERKDTLNAKYWANSIINMPIKVPSNLTNNIVKSTKLIQASLIY